MKKRLQAIILIMGMSVSLTACKSSDYKGGVELQEQGNYEEALIIFKDLGDYKDATTKAETCQEILDAQQKYNDIKVIVDKKNNELSETISKGEELLNKKEKALDEQLIPELEAAISKLKEEKFDVPSIDGISDSISILEIVQTLEVVDYSDVIKNFSEKYDALDKSIKQYALVNAPKEGYVIKCLEEVEHIVGIGAATEDNDPNGKMNKAGGYTAQVYFADDRLSTLGSDQGSSIIEKGTDGGGSIEVYTTEEDAIKRNDYLASFDGTIFSGGSHIVIGTVVVRISDDLTATKQKEMERSIIDKLTYVE